MSDPRVRCVWCGHTHESDNCDRGIPSGSFSTDRRAQYTRFVKHAMEHAEITVAILADGHKAILFTLGHHTHRWDVQ